MDTSITGDRDHVNVLFFWEMPIKIGVLLELSYSLLNFFAQKAALRDSVIVASGVNGRDFRFVHYHGKMLLKGTRLAVIVVVYSVYYLRSTTMDSLFARDELC